MSESSGEQWLREGACQSIQKYRAGKITLRSLVNDLSSIFLELEELPYGEELRSQWWELEQIYAVALDRGYLHELPRQDELDIQETLDVLERLLS
ncbi:hypothetical protein LX16_1761 [Stackebrandtia albiflava]|uniref:Self-protective colicin-like immunity protein n=1 Tax=Stackebrandtia albiflava TaxID=406432 RepID=A0A562VDT7_9ACTN|nr:hypothetical protein [Stackebrandtia albiflava]TWJ16040.1 hypothetical protein LX16_1761 [Stackebrandtia albiflava]